MTACGIDGPFIMPLLFSPDPEEAYKTISKHNLGKKQNKSNKSNSSKGSQGSVTSQQRQGVPVGHLLLVVAERDPQSTDNIIATIFDSSPDSVDDQTVREVYESLITHSGWLGISRAGVPLRRRPSFTERHARVHTQTRAEGNTCGIYTILAAWAYMLNIPAYESPDRRPRTTTVGSPEFHRNAVEMIDLALGGHMDAETVQAFMNCFGYSVRQEEENPVPNVRMVDAVRPGGTLQDEVQYLHQLERLTGTSERSATSERQGR